MKVCVFGVYDEHGNALYCDVIACDGVSEEATLTAAALRYPTFSTDRHSVTEVEDGTDLEQAAQQLNLRAFGPGGGVGHLHGAAWIVPKYHGYPDPSGRVNPDTSVFLGFGIYSEPSPSCMGVDRTFGPPIACYRGRTYAEAVAIANHVLAHGAAVIHAVPSLPVSMPAQIWTPELMSSARPPR